MGFRAYGRTGVLLFMEHFFMEHCAIRGALLGVAHKQHDPMM
jgi:hypothetical protein